MEGKNVNPEPSRRLNYAVSQDPDELSQANAIDLVDKLLLSEEDYDSTIPSLENSRERIMSSNSISAPNLGTKVAKYLSNRTDKKSLVRKMGAFEFTDPFEEERERDVSLTYDVGPSTQIAAEAMEALFNAPPTNTDEKIIVREREKESVEGLVRESVFMHPKRRRTTIWHPDRNSNSIGGTAKSLHKILDSVKRKRRSQIDRRNLYGNGIFRANNGNFAISRGQVENKIFLKYRGKNKHMGGVHVVLSQNLEQVVIKQQKKILSRFGARIVPSMFEATHFVADKFVRTKNMLEAIAMGKPIVTHKWLDSCIESGTLIREENYILRDLKKEQDIGFNLFDSLNRARQYPLLQGWRVLVTKKVWPDKDMLKSLVKAAHGQVVERMSRYTTNYEDLKGNFFIISCEEDYAICLPLLQIGVGAYDSELLLKGIVTQKLDFDRHRLFSGRS